MIPISIAGKYDQPPLWHRLRDHAKQPAMVFIPFAAGYILSYAFRTVNGPIADQLIETFQLGPRDLGLLTSVYFLSFAAFQIPAGLLIDRYGPRRVQAALLVIAAAGAFLFAIAPDRPTLMLSRALIGLGSSGALLTGLKALSLWMPPQRRTMGNCYLVMCGGLGAMASTVPLDAVAGVLAWRSIFVILAATTLAVAGLVWTVVPDATRTRVDSLGDTWRGFQDVVGDPRFWRMAPLSASVVGSVFAIHGLWAARWLADVPRLTQSEVASVLLAMGASLTVGAGTLGLLATYLRRWGSSTTTLFGAACIVFLAVEAVIVSDTAFPPVMSFGAFAVFGAITVLSFTIIGELFPPEMAGRANGALNVLHLGAAFVAQAAIGAVVALWPTSADGHVSADAYKAAFAIIVAIQVVALLWFALTAARKGLVPGQRVSPPNPQFSLEPRK